MKVQDSSVLVTGGAGFIGSHLVDELASRGAHRVVVVDDLSFGSEDNLGDPQSRSDAVVLIHGDARDTELLRRLVLQYRVSTVFDLATVQLLASLEQPARASGVIWELALAVAELARTGAADCIVRCSSSEAYGSAIHVPMREEHPLLVETPYAAAKAAGDLLLRSYSRTFGVKVITLRPFNNYGPRQNSGRLAAIIPKTIGSLLNGQPPVVSGDGRQTRDFNFVRDTARAIVDLAETMEPSDEVINIGSGKEVEVRELVENLCRIMDYRGSWCTVPDRPGDVRRHLADTRRFREILPDFSTTDLRVGLESTVSWYRQKAGCRAS